ncbi:MAG: hypothetical protein RLZZ450_7774 [Pseudomonadota bacterium]|jgi:hypothetical protein
MTKRLILVASAIWVAVGCGSEDPPRTSSRGDAGTIDQPKQRDAGTVKPDAKTPPDSTVRPPTASNGKSDSDEDGFTVAEGDCNDSDKAVNPGAYDFPGDLVDDDCSGDAAEEDEPCDGALKIDSSDAKDAARALGLCKFIGENEKGWGVVSARFTDASGTGKLSDPRAVGILPDFGAAKPGDGKAFLALSSGVARAPNQAGYTSDCDSLDATCPLGGILGCSGGLAPPPGYPKEAPSCKAPTSIFSPGTKVFNQAALELKVRVPNNASSFAFDSIFYTYEFPKFVCSKFNDFFVVFKEPKPTDLPDSNIVFDTNGDSIGVNTGLLAVCDKSTQLPDAPKQFDCAQGTALLKGTGYGAGESTCPDAGGAATGWLHTKAPVDGGEIITVRFAIWDTNDAILDSTVLVDSFKWSPDDSEVGTVPVIPI